MMVAEGVAGRSMKAKAAVAEHEKMARVVARERSKTVAVVVLRHSP